MIYSYKYVSAAYIDRQKERTGVFGYVKPYPGNLLVREYEYYRAAYCGLCRTMRRHTGLLSAASLSYELLLLALVRMLYGDPTTPVKRRRCPLHPLKRRPIMEENPALVYAARISALLSYYKIKDDIKDDRGLKRLVAFSAQPVFSGARRKARLPRLDADIAASLHTLSQLEEARTPSVDECAEVFGDMLGKIFAYEMTGSDARVTYAFGRCLGRYIYAADAAEDYEKDRASGRFNPYCAMWGGPLTAERKQNMHTALLLELRGLESAMNLLPAEGQDALFHIIANTVCEGLPDRIRFLTDDETATAQPAKSQEQVQEDQTPPSDERA